MAMVDGAVLKHIEKIMLENTRIERTIYEFLNESPNSVQKYIELIKYIRSKELILSVRRVSENLALT